MKKFFFIGILMSFSAIYGSNQKDVSRTVLFVDNVNALASFDEDGVVSEIDKGGAKEGYKLKKLKKSSEYEVGLTKVRVKRENMWCCMPKEGKTCIKEDEVNCARGK